MTETKSLGEKLHDASGSPSIGGLSWADYAPSERAWTESVALRFAASLTHDETSNAVIADLQARLSAETAARERVEEELNDLLPRHSIACAKWNQAEARVVELEGALKAFADVAARYPTGGLNADIEQRSPDVLKSLSATDFYRARAALSPTREGGAS